MPALRSTGLTSCRECPLHAQFSLLQIEVIPPERESLPEAHSGSRHHEEQRVVACGLSFDGGQKAGELLTVHRPYVLLPVCLGASETHGTTETCCRVRL